MTDLNDKIKEKEKEAVELKAKERKEKGAKQYIDMCQRLPLENMINPSVIKGVFTIEHFAECHRIPSEEFKFGSWKALFLAFYMDKNHNMEWSDNEWVEKR